MRSVRLHKISPKKKPAAKLSGPPRKTTLSESTAEASLNQHKPAKKSRNRIPPPQRERIFQKYVAGKSVAEISREENRNRETVTKIVRSEEMCEYVKGMREEYYGLASSALVTVRHRVEQGKDAQLAYRVLVDVGVVPDASDRHEVQMEKQLAEWRAILTERQKDK
jgi:hypothetical protein